MGFALNLLSQVSYLLLPSLGIQKFPLPFFQVKLTKYANNKSCKHIVVQVIQEFAKPKQNLWILLIQMLQSHATHKK